MDINIFRGSDIHTVGLTLSILSPMFLLVCMIALCFVNKNVNGLVYLGFYIAAYFIREFIGYQYCGNTTTVINGNKSNVASSGMPLPKGKDTVLYTHYGNAFFSIFTFAFTIAYITYPMIMNKQFNYIIFLGIALYFLYDFMVKWLSGYLNSDFKSVFVNFFGGYTLGTLFPLFMYMGNSEKFLLTFDTTSADKCGRNSSGKKYNCAVYQNGKLMGHLSDD